MKKSILLTLLVGILMVFGLGSHALAAIDLNAAHTTIYIDNPTFDCSSCHRSIIHLEHTTRIDLNTGKYYNCDTCHASTAKAEVQTAILLKDTRCDACHVVHGPIDVVHATDPSCTSCHKATLNAEHFSRINPQTNRPYNCNTCHNNTNPTVMTAIANKNTKCAACHVPHGPIDHGSAYVLNKEVDCAQCHNNQLDQEHTGRINPATGMNYTCDVCHKSTNPTVTNAIKNKTKNCDVCHASRHATVTHTSVYVANPTMNCAQCHGNTLTGVHVGTTTNAGVTMDCNTCHTNSSTEVKSAISTGNTNCDACHAIHADVTTAHTSTYVTNPEVDCSKCHNAVISTEHASRNGSNGQPMTCDTCHNSTATAVVNAINNKNTKCDACHTTRHANATHGNGTTFMVNPSSSCADCHDRKIDVEHGKSSSTTSTGEAITCNTCHTSTRLDVQTAITTHNSQCTACHSTAGAHPNATHGEGTAFVANPASNCTDCHTRKLDAEHSKASSTTSTGGAITCNICHQSTNTAVKNAIATKNSQCDACHSSTGLGTYHNTNHGSGTAFMTNPQSLCADCHNRVLDTEHVGNVTNSGVTLTCTSCHQSTVAAVQNAIASKNNQCTACHSTAGTHPNANHVTTTFTTDTTTQNCAKCHNTDISVEHSSSSDKVNSAGAKMTCNTCHQSTNTVVKNAIATNNTACTACHATGGVATPHSGVADPHKQVYFQETTTRCMTCHTTSGIGYALSTTTNIAYHKVKEGTAYYPSGISITSTSTQTDSGSFVSPYTKTTDLTCNGCHDTSNGTATGTTYGKLLIGEYSTNTGKSGLTTSSHLCFKCHNYSTYTSTGSGSAFTAHTKSDHEVGCMGCHNIKPHAQSGRRHFIAIKGQAGASTNNMVTAYSHSTSYSKSNCSTSCTNNNNH